MSELYDAIRRIQELEKQVQELTKRADDAEFSAKALRANNKDLQAELRGQLKVPVQAHIPSIVFASDITVPLDTIRDADNYASFAQAELSERFKRELGECLVREGYVKDMVIHTEREPRDYVVRYRLEGKLNITK